MYFSVDEFTGKSNTLSWKLHHTPKNLLTTLPLKSSADSEDHCIIVLSNQMGRILRMMGVNVNQGKNQIHVDNVNTLEAGIYQLSVKNTNSNILYSSILTKF